MPIISQSWQTAAQTPATGRVIFAPPAERDSLLTPGAIVSTSSVDAPLDNDGAISVELEAGFLTYRTLIDGAERESGIVNIPVTDGPHRLYDLKFEFIPYEPPVVSQVAGYVTAAQGAATRAEDAADGVAGIADDVEAVAVDRAAAGASAEAARQHKVAAASSATSAASSASTSTSKAAAAAGSVTAAAGSANAANTSATTAASEAGDAATSATGATSARNTATQASSAAVTAANAAENFRDSAAGLRDETEIFRNEAADAATGGIADGSLDRVKFAPSVKTALTRADTAVLEGDARLDDARTPLSHHHTLDEIDGFADAADGLAADVALKADVSALDGKADLGTNGKIVTSQIPALAISSRTLVADRTGLLALDAQGGDVGIVQAGDPDQGSYILGEGVPTSFASWALLVAPEDVVQSVNGQVGPVNLGAVDVGAAPSTHGHAIGDVTGLQGAIDARPPTLIVDVLPASPTAGVLYLVREA